MVMFFISPTGDHRDLHSFPTRRSSDLAEHMKAAKGVRAVLLQARSHDHVRAVFGALLDQIRSPGGGVRVVRSEEHTSELQSPVHLVCRLLLEKKNSPVEDSIRQLVCLK